MNESPSPAIRVCSRLTAVAPALAQRLFNAAFMSCWKELKENEQDELITMLEAALRFTTTAGGRHVTEISQVVLNLEEFMAHVDKVSKANPPSHFLSFSSLYSSVSHPPFQLVRPLPNASYHSPNYLTNCTSYIYPLELKLWQPQLIG